MSEVIFAGYGGQGIIMCGIVVGTAASIHDNKFATMSQSFGPEARGGACSCQLVLSESKVQYPYVRVADVLVAMFQEAYEKFEPQLSDEGILLIEEDLVKLNPSIRKGIKVFSIPATRFAEELGNRVIANVVMLGFFTGVTGLVSNEGMEKAISKAVPSRFIELNLKAFKKGYEYGVAQIKG